MNIKFYNFYVFLPETFLFVSILTVTIGYLVARYRVNGFMHARSLEVDFFSVLLNISSAILVMLFGLFTFQLQMFLKREIWLSFSFTLMNNVDLVLFKMFVVVLVLFVLNSTALYFRKLAHSRPEYILVLLVYLFATLIGLSANDFLLFYLAFELQGLCLYILIFLIVDYSAVRAGLYYFFLSLISSAFFLFGLSWIYFYFGTFNYDEINMLIQTSTVVEQTDIFFVMSQLFIFFAVFFKLGLFPFYFWIYRVYEYVTFPVVFVLATVSKVFAFLVFVKFIFVFVVFDNVIAAVIYWVGVCSVIYGVFGGLVQYDIRKLIGYGSIAQMGYVAIALSYSDIAAITIASFYFFMYIFFSFCFFYFLVSFFDLGKDPYGNRSFVPISNVFDFNNIFKENWMVGFFVVSLIFSYMGIPPFLGFFSKYLLFWYLVTTGHFATFFFVLTMSVISTNYYLRIVISVYKSTNVRSKILASGVPGFCMIVLLILLNFFGILFFVCLKFIARSNLLLI